MSEELEIDETNYKEMLSIDESCESMTISNESELELDDAEGLIEHLKKIHGLDRITKLTINYNSTLRDLKVLSAFSNLKVLYILGKRIRTFHGIESFSQGNYIRIDTYRNRRRDISELFRAHVIWMDLYVERPEDIDAISLCGQLKQLDVYRSMEIDLHKWRRVPFESIQFKRGKFVQLGGTAAISSLHEISVLGCRSLERFTGDNSRITRLTVANCKQLDLRTLNTFESIEVLIVNSCTKELNLTDIGGLKYVKHIMFILCNVQVDLIDLKEYFPSLESLHISKMKKEFGLLLKELNPDVQIGSDSFQIE